MINKEVIAKNIQEFDELIKITKKTRDEAIAAQATSKAVLDNSVKTLAKHQITPENADVEILKMETEIESLIQDIKDGIPYETLQKLKRI